MKIGYARVSTQDQKLELQIDALQQDGDLHKLDVSECRVPEDVNVSNNESGAGGTVFEKSDNCNVVTRHDTVENVVLPLHVRSIDGGIGKVDELFVQQDVPDRVRHCIVVNEPRHNLLAVLVENSTAINKLGFSIRHCPRSRLGPEHSLVIVVC